jgi:hypothetical protein
VFKDEDLKLEKFELGKEHLVVRTIPPDPAKADATELNARPWSYLKVPQAGFDRLQPGAFRQSSGFENPPA